MIHGEYYPHNILVTSGRIYPIDWESVAIAAGEIDLAALTEDWSPELVRQCEQEYQQTRWGSACPPDFAQRLAAARLYLCFRWLGDRPQWTVMEDNLCYFERLRPLGVQLGII